MEKTIWLFIQFHLNPWHFPLRYPRFGSFLCVHIYVCAYITHVHVYVCDLWKSIDKNAQDAKFFSQNYRRSREEAKFFALVNAILRCNHNVIRHQNLMSYERGTGKYPKNNCTRARNDGEMTASKRFLFNPRFQNLLFFTWLFPLLFRLIFIRFRLPLAYWILLLDEKILNKEWRFWGKYIE